MARLKVAGVGAGYFSRFHYDAWSRIDDVELVGICDLDRAKAQALCDEFGGRVYDDIDAMIDAEAPDLVDLITPPPTHLDLCRRIAGRGVNLICQKPLAPSFVEARALVESVSKAGVRFAVHENWRFQPWYREIKRLLDGGAIGSLHSIYFRSRMGDGWGDDAYLNRQPYFRDYPRLLVYENGVHFIDTFRYLVGEVSEVYARMRKLNPVIQGEDRCTVIFAFENGAEALWDANRYNESNQPNPRYTFGECLVEGDGGSIRLYSDGTLTVQKLGEPEAPHDYAHQDRGFAGDCAFFFCRHAVEALLSGAPFETGGEDYLKTLAVQEAIYRSADENRVVTL